MFRGSIQLPDKVKELDKLIADYIVEAHVVVPLPNPKFDSSEFDRAQIGVQAGGLKMPPGFKGKRKRQRGSKAKPSRPAKELLGWTAKGAAATVRGDVLEISPANRQPFIANAKMNADGPVDIRLRIRPQKSGTGRVQWRTEGQDSFPKEGQRQSFDLTGGDWQDLSVPLAVKGRLIHLRLFLSDSKQPTEIDWIEVGPKDGDARDRKRWDFKQTPDKKQTRPDPGANRRRQPPRNATEKVTLTPHTFSIPDGYELKRVAASPLVERPIICASLSMVFATSLTVRVTQGQHRFRSRTRRSNPRQVRPQTDKPETRTSH